MKKLLFILVPIELCFGGMQVGVYKGEGNWRSGSESGRYQVEAQITNDEIKNLYHWADQRIEFNVKTQNTSAWEFLLKNYKNQPIGLGFCMGIQCHYELKKGSDLEETLTFYQGHLYRLGSKRIQARLISWIEDLQLQN